jgi:hypothetical protein
MTVGLQEIHGKRSNLRDKGAEEFSDSGHFSEEDDWSTQQKDIPLSLFDKNSMIGKDMYLR